MKTTTSEWAAGQTEAMGKVDQATPVFRQYLEIAVRRRYTIAAVVAFCVFSALLLTLLMTPKYTAGATIEISRESGNVTNIQGVEREANIADQEFYQTQYGLLRSRTLAERVAADLELEGDPVFFSMFGHSSEDEAFDLTSGRYSAGGRGLRLRVAGEILLDNLEVNPTRLSRLVNIDITTPSAELSARIANSWAENFIESNLDRKIDASAYGRRALEGELAKAKQQLDESQRRLVDYAASQQIINLAGADPDAAGETGQSLVSQELSALNRALSAARAARIEAQARYREASSSGASSEMLENVAINRLRERRAELNAEYERLLVQFEPEYPRARSLRTQIDQIDDSIRAEERRVLAALQSEFRSTQERERQLTLRVDGLTENFLDLQRRSIQYNIFQQEVDTNRALYDGLLRRYEEIGVAGDVGTNNVASVDPAIIPEEPSSPSFVLNLALALFAGLGLGALGALIFEQMDEAISSPEQLRRISNLPLLGTIPKVAGVDPGEEILDRKSELSESLLAIQTSLAFASSAGIPSVIGVTSTKAAEGKSTTAVGLATMMSRSARHVVVVDADMRSPSLHAMLGEALSPGLSDYLSGSAELETILRSDESAEFTFVTAGSAPGNPAELMTGPRLRKLLSELSEKFDNVLVDAPPVLGLADAPLLASHLDGVVFVVEFEKTNSKAMQASLERLSVTNAKVLGTIMTKYVNKVSQTQYAYGYGAREGAA